MTGTVKDATDSVKDSASDATDSAKDATGTLKEQAVGAFANAAKDILGPAIQQMSQQAAEQAATFAKEQGPKLVKDQVLPQVLKSVGVGDPSDLPKAALGKAGEMMSGAGGITGVAGKLFSKLGGGKGGGSATGYGAKRRMPIQQDMFVSVNVEDAYKGWTEYKRWTEFMHRANLVDPDINDEEGQQARLKVTEKMWGFKRPFTAEVVSQQPNEHIRWKSTEGTKHVGVVSFHELAPHLTLISLNIDHAPSGLIEKTARGNRFVKRAIRADFHRFKGWIEHKSPEEIEEMEGWLGSIEDGQIITTHEDMMGEEWEGGSEPEDEDEDQEDEQEDEENDEDKPSLRSFGDAEDEGDEDEEPEDEEEDEEPEPEPEPPKAKRKRKRTPA